MAPQRLFPNYLNVISPFSISSSILLDHWNSRRKCPKGCENVSRVALLRILQVHSNIFFTFSIRIGADATVSTAFSRTVLFKHAIIHGSAPNCFTASSLNITSDSVAKGVQYVLWEHKNRNMVRCSTRPVAPSIAQQQSPRNSSSFTHFLLHNVWAQTLLYHAIQESHLLLAHNCQWARWANCSLTPFFSTWLTLIRTW